MHTRRIWHLNYCDRLLQRELCFCSGHSWHNQLTPIFVAGPWFYLHVSFTLGWDDLDPTFRIYFCQYHHHLHAKLQEALWQSSSNTRYRITLWLDVMVNAYSWYWAGVRKLTNYSYPCSVSLFHKLCLLELAASGSVAENLVRASCRLCLISTP